MIKYIATTALALTLVACTGTEEEKTAKRNQAVNLAVDRIERFNELGTDPLQLDPTRLLALDTACVTVLLFGTEVGLEEDTMKNIGAACDVIMKAAAPADDSNTE